MQKAKIGICDGRKAMSGKILAVAEKLNSTLANKQRQGTREAKEFSSHLDAARRDRAIQQTTLADRSVGASTTKLDQGRAADADQAGATPRFAQDGAANGRENPPAGLDR